MTSKPISERLTPAGPYMDICEELSRELAEERARLDSAIRTLQEIAAMGRKAGSELARHRLHELGVDVPDYGSMT